MTPPPDPGDPAPAADAASAGAPAIYRYTGRDGDYYDGIPARDLTADDIAALSDADRDLVEAGIIYTRVGGNP